MIPMLLVAAGCGELGNTEEQSLDVSFGPLFYSAVDPFVSGERALVGSNACAYIFMTRTAAGWDYLDPPCHSITVGGAVLDEGDCINLDQVGELSFEYTPADNGPGCGDVVGGLVPDRFRMQVIPIDGLRARLEWQLERFVQLWGSPGPAGRFPDDLVPPPDEPLALVPGVTALFPVDVIDQAGGLVAWSPERGRMLESRDGAPPREVLPLEGDGVVWPVRVEPGERVTLTLELSGTQLPVAEVVATSADRAASLEIVVAYDAPPEDDPELTSAPVGARAMVRDADGKVIYGAPVEWTLLEGHLALGPIEDFTPELLEYTAIADACDPPPSAPRPRRAVVQARLGNLVDEVELQWTALPEDEPDDEPFEPNAACQRAGGELGDRGCGCTSSAGPAGDRRAGWAWMLVVLAALARRRRPGYPAAADVCAHDRAPGRALRRSGPRRSDHRG